MWKIVGVSVVVRERFKAKLLKVYLVLYAYAQWKGFVLSVPSFYSTARSISLSDI